MADNIDVDLDFIFERLIGDYNTKFFNYCKNKISTEDKKQLVQLYIKREDLDINSDIKMIEILKSYYKCPFFGNEFFKPFLFDFREDDNYYDLSSSLTSFRFEYEKDGVNFFFDIEEISIGYGIWIAEIDHQSIDFNAVTQQQVSQAYIDVYKIMADQVNYQLDLL